MPHTISYTVAHLKSAVRYTLKRFDDNIYSNLNGHILPRCLYVLKSEKFKDLREILKCRNLYLSTGSYDVTCLAWARDKGWPHRGIRKLWRCCNFCLLQCNGSSMITWAFPTHTSLNPIFEKKTDRKLLSSVNRSSWHFVGILWSSLGWPIYTEHRWELISSLHWWSRSPLDFEKCSRFGSCVWNTGKGQPYL